MNGQPPPRTVELSEEKGAVMHILGTHPHAMHVLCAVCVLAAVGVIAFGPSAALGFAGALACAAMMGMMVWMMVGMAVKHRR